MAKRKKLPDYTKRAIKNYESRRDRLVVMAPLGLKDRIKKVLSVSGFDSVSAFCVSAVLEKLEALEEIPESIPDFCAGDPGEMEEDM